jgi:hypothetical protein
MEGRNRVGYDGEMVGLEPVEPEGHAHMLFYWRREANRAAHIVN